MKCNNLGIYNYTHIIENVYYDEFTDNITGDTINRLAVGYVLSPVACGGICVADGSCVGDGGLDSCRCNGCIL